MTVNARQALEHFVSAIETHFEAVVTRRGPDDAAVDDAYEAIAAAFERYEEALDVDFDESLPLMLDDTDDFEAEVDDVVDEILEDDDLDEDIEEFDLTGGDET